MYINCPYAIDFYGVILQENSVPNDIVPLCTGAEIKMCNRLSLEKDNFDSEKYGVNGKLCKDWYDTRKTCEDQIVAAGFDLAAWMDADECVISPINEQVTIIPESSIKDTDVTEHKDQVCCSVKKKA